LAPKRDVNGCVVTDQLPLPVVDSLADLRDTYRIGLQLLASVPRKKAKMPREELIAIILQLCSRQFITLGCLAEILSRNPDNLRNQYLSPLVREKKLALAFPTTPNHKRQAYCSAAALQVRSS
jgi:ATP-dependent DNA helicase RecG